MLSMKGPHSEGGGLRVLFVIPGEGQGNSMIFARRQAATLRARGVEVHQFFLKSRTSMSALVREMRRFRAEIRILEPDIVHAHFGTVTAMFAALGAGRRPLVITYRGSDLNPSPGAPVFRKGLGHLLSQLAALRARRIVCVSAPLRRRLWWNASRAVVLPSGVDPVVFCARPRGQARRSLEWAEAQPVVLFNAGSDSRIKRADLAFAAIAAARRSLPNMRLERVDGTTPPEHMPVLMNASDCLLLTSDFEGSPTVVQEALACNLPIVSVDVGDVAERIEGVENACLASRDAEMIGAAVAEMVRTPRRTDGFRKLAEFSTDYVASQLSQLYAQALHDQTVC
jgi:teichuronic acid biosynthesis glycosyltransferase TuaC